MYKYSKNQEDDCSMEPEEIGFLGTVLMIVLGGIMSYFFWSGLYNAYINLIK